MNLLVTGGSRGIGKAIVDKFSNETANTVFYIHKDSSLKLHSKQNVHGFVCDVRDEENIRGIIKNITAIYGKIDVLVNNAGITQDSTFLKMTSESWREVIETNLMSIFEVTQQVYKKMVKPGDKQPQGGAIINIASVVGQKGNFGQANYAASKAGIIGFTKSLAIEGAKYGVTVNAIAPGFVDTEMVAVMPENVLDSIKAQIPLKRLGLPKEIADIVYFLTTDAGRYITGQVINYNGGFYM